MDLNFEALQSLRSCGPYGIGAGPPMHHLEAACCHVLGVAWHHGGKTRTKRAHSASILEPQVSSKASEAVESQPPACRARFTSATTQPARGNTWITINLAKTLAEGGLQTTDPVKKTF